MTNNNLPNPDPTAQTTDIVRREIAQTNEASERALGNLEKQQNIKFEHIQKEFERVDKQFDDRDKRTLELADGMRREVDTAFESNKEATQQSSETQKEARLKSEESTGKLIAALSTRYEDVKERLGNVESKSAGGGSAIEWVIKGVLFLIALAAFLSKG